MKQTILVTGGTGYVGSWVTKVLLEQGYVVRLAVRDKHQQHKYKHLVDIEMNTPGKMEIWEANLLDPGSYDEAAKGADAIMHMASPFTLRAKNPQKELIEPALEGTRNVLQAANRSDSVKKVVLTSSIVAVFGDNVDMHEQGLSEYNESQFNSTSTLSHQPYNYSKVLAEKEAWKMHQAQSQWKLVVINPTFVLGPSLTGSSDSESLVFMKDMLRGKYAPGVPKIQYGVVDVRDVAKAHLLGLEQEDAEGRHILAESVAEVWDMSRIIQKQFPGKYNLPLMKTPKPLMYFFGPLFGFPVKFVKRNVGYDININAGKSREQLGLKYRALDTTLKDMVNSMEEQK